MLSVGRKYTMLISFHVFCNLFVHDVCKSFFLTILFIFVLGCTKELMFETKTVAVGDNVTLTCPRLNSEHGTVLYWIRFVSGNWPEFLGGTYSFDSTIGKKTPHITTKQEPGTFTLHISNFEQSDVGLYYCMKAKLLNMTFMKGDALTIKGKEKEICLEKYLFRSRVFSRIN